MLQYAASGKAALVFGPEDKGLNTTEIDLCSLTVCIPTAKASSLNLAQAVMTLAYEMRISAMSADGLGRGQAKRPAPMGELEGLKDPTSRTGAHRHRRIHPGQPRPLFPALQERAGPGQSPPRPRSGP
jgi:tRNA C32,U32 (ribose-2'-O)-methylase TrmJ